MQYSFKQAQFATSAFELSQLPPDQGIEIAFAGRSNAGKSSAINCLTRQQNLCKTSKTPGRTQLINFFALTTNRSLVDLPGYGFAKVSKKMRDHWDYVLTRYLLEREALRGLVIVVDIRRGIGELDQLLIDMVKENLALHILLTKSDKVSRHALQNACDLAKQYLPDPRHSVSALSTLTGNGVGDLERVCRHWLKVGT